MNAVEEEINEGNEDEVELKIYIKADLEDDVSVGKRPKLKKVKQKETRIIVLNDDPAPDPNDTTLSQEQRTRKYLQYLNAREEFRKKSMQIEPEKPTAAESNFPPLQRAPHQEQAMSTAAHYLKQLIVDPHKLEDLRPSIVLLENLDPALTAASIVSELRSEGVEIGRIHGFKPLQIALVAFSSFEDAYFMANAVNGKAIGRHAVSATHFLSQMPEKGFFLQLLPASLPAWTSDASGSTSLGTAHSKTRSAAGQTEQLIKRALSDVHQQRSTANQSAGGHKKELAAQPLKHQVTGIAPAGKRQIEAILGRNHKKNEQPGPGTQPHHPFSIQKGVSESAARKDPNNSPASQTYGFGQVVLSSPGCLSLLSSDSTFKLRSQALTNVGRIAPKKCALFLFNATTRALHGAFRSETFGMDNFECPLPAVTFSCGESFGYGLGADVFGPVFPVGWVERRPWRLPLLLSEEQVNTLLILFRSSLRGPNKLPSAVATAGEASEKAPMQEGSDAMDELQCKLKAVQLSHGKDKESMAAPSEVLEFPWVYELVTCSLHRVRSGPFVSAPEVGLLPPNCLVVAQEKSSHWIRILTKDGKECWSMAENPARKFFQRLTDPLPEKDMKALVEATVIMEGPCLPAACPIDGSQPHP